ncbi:MAG: DEAD/DEAH box helicase [Gordonibacter pamelaeae]
MRFSEAVRGWFLDAFPAGATPVQEQAWEAVEDGENALVIAPTGSGKTLAAFLFALDALMREQARPAAARPPHGVRVLYVSPLKALGADVERNLQAPLAGIAQRLAAEGAPAPAVRTGMRTGDTTPDQRRAIQRNPPDILITTPESLYLMLTSKAREVLRGVETVIEDEVHALAGNKRGAHLALSLERLDDLLERPGAAHRALGHGAAGGRGGALPRRAAPCARHRGSGKAGPGRARGGARARHDGHPGPSPAPTPTGRAPAGAAGRAALLPAEEAWKSDRALRSLIAGDKPRGATPTAERARRPSTR